MSTSGVDIFGILEELKSSISKTLPKTLIKKVILFGSVAKGLEKVNSDIDIFILVKDATSKKRLEPSIDKLSNLCFEIYGNRLAPYILTESEMRQKKNLKIIFAVNTGLQIFPKTQKPEKFLRIAKGFWNM